MSGFSAEWLALREPQDRQARDRAAQRLGLDAALAGWRRPTGSGALPVVDLGCGSGANRRWLAPRLGGLQRWLLVDDDPALLDRAVADGTGRSVAGGGARRGRPGPSVPRLPPAPDAPPGQGPGPGADAAGGSPLAGGVQALRLDLASALEAVPIPPRALVTASALLDLVSSAWLDRLLAACRQADAAVLFSLSVDGRMGWSPTDPEDLPLRRAFEAHQRRDKGFGPALGPAATRRAAQLWRAAGYRLRRALSDWRLDAGDAALLAALIDGMCEAASEQQPERAAIFRGWRERRHGQLGRTRLCIGHVDLLALPGDAAGRRGNGR